MDTTTYETFEKLDIRVGKVVSAEKVEKSKNLLKLQVDIGEPQPRQIVSGISSWYSPEELVDRFIIVLVNLKPRKLMGIESQGMLLAADVEDTAVLLEPDSKFGNKVNPGVGVK